MHVLSADVTWDVLSACHGDGFLPEGEPESLNLVDQMVVERLGQTR